MLTFGLVSVPIRLYAAARAKRIYLHQIHCDCHTRLKQPLFCPHCNRIVDRSEVIKGYEYETGQYVLVEGEDIKKITPESGKTMEILAFVPAAEVDPIYFESSFLAMPEAPHREGRKAPHRRSNSDFDSRAPFAQESELMLEDFPLKTTIPQPAGSSS